MIDKLVINSDSLNDTSSTNYNSFQRKILTKIIHLQNQYHANNNIRPTELYASIKVLSVLIDTNYFTYNTTDRSELVGYLLDMRVYRLDWNINNRVILSCGKNLIRDNKINIILGIEQKEYEYVLEVESDFL